MAGATMTRSLAAASFCLVVAAIGALSIRKAPGDMTSRDRTVQSDICIFGGTPAGLAAAVQARRMDRTAVLVEPTRHLGGMTTGGLGATDIGNKDAIGGISREFYRRVAHHYSETSAWRFETSREYFDGQGKTGGSESDLSALGATMWTFEPHVASQIFEEMIGEAGPGVYLGRRLKAVEKDGRRIAEIVSEDGTVFRARIFIDASYEGDLMAAAGVSCRVGREANAEYGETLNGIREQTPFHQFRVPVDPFVKRGEPASGLLPFIQPGELGRPGDRDRRVQAYNYRLCFTMNPDNRLEIAPPPDYSPAKYELLARYVEALVATGEKLTLSQFWNPVRMPNRKTDINNNGAFSTDFLGASWEYPEAVRDKRERLAKDHEYYIRGFLHFLATSPRVPETMRAEMREWGPCRDEFTDNAGWPTQLYVREARRLVSDYVMTEKNCRGREVVADSVGLAAYNMDSHNVRRLERSGRAENEGDVQVAPMAPYPISYRAIIPRASECENLAVPVCLSATHIAYGSIRMEPVFMILGQSAATAACLAIEKEVPLQKLNYAALRARLLKDGQILEWRTARTLKGGVDCTAFVMRRGGAALLGRNLDSPALGGYLFVNKRGVSKEAFGAGSANSLSWTSRYGSVTFNQFGREFPLAGMNEAGLVIEGLGGPANYPPADRRPPVNELQWIQYQLDTCGSVKDALKSDRAIRISRLFFDLHYLIADRKGAVAVVEFEAGKMRTFTRGELPVSVLADSGYEESIRGLGLRADSQGERAVREGTPSDERFARVAGALDEYGWLGQTPIVDQAFSVLRSVERPDTRWSAVYSPRSRRLFLKTRAHRRYKILGLDSLDFSCGSPSLMLPVDTDATGNLSRSFVAYDTAANRQLLDSVTRQLRQSGGFAPGLPDETIRRMSDYPLTCRCR
jgi:penicillin V acylase-like amidase (Ntn superfamily)